MTLSTKTRQLVDDYMKQLDEVGHVVAEETTGSITALCRLATSSDSVQVRAGTEALFGGIVEPLADRFENALCEIYVELFTEVIDFCRRLPEGRTLDRKLSDFKLNNRQNLIDRANRIRRPAKHDLGYPARLRRILVLSRVTLGADIAVTSIVLAKMKRFAPDVEIKLVGGTKAASFFAGDSHISHVLVDYHREGSLLNRLHAWVTLAETVSAEIDGLDGDEFLIIDPDSRLTQLGVLPLTLHDKGYYFLEMRSFGLAGHESDLLSANNYTEMSLSQLTASYLESLFGKDEEMVYPNIHLGLQDRYLGDAMRKVCGTGLAAVSFGVGSNEAKRIDEEFEHKLVVLLVERGYRVVLDRGAGSDELRRMDILEASLVNHGLSLGRIHRSDIQLADVMTWEGSLSAFAGLIGAADLYVGYDSAGGHLASALEIPVITVFAGAANRRMRERWSPRGRSTTDVIAVGSGEKSDSVLRRVREVL